jgi:hypothetical protein
MLAQQPMKFVEPNRFTDPDAKTRASALRGFISPILFEPSFPFEFRLPASAQSTSAPTSRTRTRASSSRARTFFLNCYLVDVCFFANGQ